MEKLHTSWNMGIVWFHCQFLLKAVIHTVLMRHKLRTLTYHSNNVKVQRNNVMPMAMRVFALRSWNLGFKSKVRHGTALACRCLQTLINSCCSLCASQVESCFWIVDYTQHKMTENIKVII
jgi:hypothetical protein